MSLFIIASIVDGNKKGLPVLGYKVLNTETGQYKLLSEASIKKYAFKLKNAEFVDDKLKGTMGDLKRYPKLDQETGFIIGPKNIVILGKDEEGFYLVVENVELAVDLIGLKSLNELKQLIYMGINYSYNIGIVSNARVINSNSLKNITIRPIKGQFEIVKKSHKFLEKEFDFGSKQKDYSSKWKIRVVKKNERYGLNYRMINNSIDPIIEFYDMTQDEEAFPIGQFVSSYFWSTLSKQDFSKGLSLYGDVKSWTLTSESMLEILKWLESVLTEK